MLSDFDGHSGKSSEYLDQAKSLEEDRFSVCTSLGIPGASALVAGMPGDPSRSFASKENVGEDFQTLQTTQREQSPNRNSVT